MPDNLFTARLREAEVRYDKVDTILVFQKSSNALIAVLREQDLMSTRRKHGPEQISSQFFVFDNKYGSRLSERNTGSTFSEVDGIDKMFPYREVDSEGCTLAWFAADIHKSTVTLHDPVHNG